MINIIKYQQLLDIKQDLQVRADWHEPDEQGVSAELTGYAFDNAGFDWEKHILITREGVPVARINLATLLAYATGYRD